MTFGDRLRTLRNERKLLQSQFGDIFGLSQSAIGAYERNEREPSLSHIVAFADYYGVSVDFLLCRTNERLTVKDYLTQRKYDYAELLNNHNVVFNGYDFADNDKQKLIDVATGLFWDRF
jgi:transcriptional regulator with XRE-family HTH domain